MYLSMLSQERYLYAEEESELLYFAIIINMILITGLQYCIRMEICWRLERGTLCYDFVPVYSKCMEKKIFNLIAVIWKKWERGNWEGENEF